MQQSNPIKIMGLDQYLTLRNKAANKRYEQIINYYNLSEEEQSKTRCPDYPISHNIHDIKWKNFDHKTEPVEVEFLYWRKANQIHDWFVKNVQNGVDDCDYYIVSIDKLHTLYKILISIAEKVALIEKDDDTFEIEFKENKSEIKAFCESILPTCDGFFFGSTDYDDDYFFDIIHTAKNLKSIFEYIDSNGIEDDSEDYAIYYHSSW